MDGAPSSLRLQRFDIEGLFGEFTYAIPLNLSEHISAIIAPNGTGKTLCLRLIEALFAKRWSVFISVQFSRIVFTFSDGTIIQIRQRVKDAKEGIAVLIKPPKLKAIPWEPIYQPGKTVGHLERYLPFLTRVGPDRWRHDHTYEVLSTAEVVEIFGESLPGEWTKTAFGAMPPELQTVIDCIDCKLIETQRLLILSDPGPEGWPGRRKSSTLAITRKAEKLKEIISAEINAYAALSQSLDRSFPKRVISHAQEMSPEGLTGLLSELDDKRKELMAAGILNTEADDPVQLPEGPLKREIASVLQVYAQDTQRKLGSLTPLLAKITLFKQLIDKRFLTKDVRVSRKHGIEVFSKGGEIPLEKLSSGEQHQLVLFFEMLFEIKSNSLILIDEPELSLHVAWQRQFIGDLKRIIELNKFDVVLATHSPQLIGEWDELVVELGQVDDVDFASGAEE